MIEFRSEPRGAAFLSLLREGERRGLGLGLVLQRTPPPGWAAFVSAARSRTVTRSLPGVQAIDPVTIIEYTLTGQVARSVVEIFGGRLFGPETNVWAQDLYVARAPDDPDPFLSTTSSEWFAVVGLSLADWRTVVSRNRPLVGLPVNDRCIRLVDEPGADDLLLELSERSDSERVALLREALTARLSSYEGVASALGAAYLVGEMFRPETVGDIGWGMAGGAPRDPDQVAALAPLAVRAVEAAAAAPLWRERWARVGAVTAATEEVHWLAGQLGERSP